MRENILRPLSPRRARLVRYAATASILFAIIAAAPRHPTGALKLASKSFKAGDSLVIAGEKFAQRDAVTLALVGVGGRVELGTAATDSVGGFRRIFLVPPSTTAGAYRLVAEAVDGDEVASVDVVVQSAVGDSMGGMHGGAMSPDMAMPAHPTGQPLPLTHARGSAVIWTFVALIIACLAAGVVLLRTPHVKPKEKLS